MKTLSIRQPWAWLIVNGYKPVENRSRSLGQHTGPLLIHASSRMTFKDYEVQRHTAPRCAAAGGGVLMKTIEQLARKFCETHRLNAHSAGLNQFRGLPWTRLKATDKARWIAVVEEAVANADDLVTLRLAGSADE